MKKIVGIIAAFALVAGTVFADPDVTPVISSFDGSAGIEWIDDLDAETTGLKNYESASFKIKFVNEGTKTTPSADGLWGELQIKAGTVEVENAEAFKVPAASVETAKIHFVDGDTSVVMNIKAPGFGVGGANGVLATASDKGLDLTTMTFGLPSREVKLTGAQGFTLETAFAGMVKANFKFADNGQQKSKAKKYAFGADATITPIAGLDIYGGFAYSQEKVGDKEPMAYAAKVNYKYAIDDTYFVQPAFGYAATNAKDDQAVGAAVLFGWGAGADDAGFLKVNGKDVVNNKVNNGVSFAMSSSLKDKAGWNLVVGAYDSSLLAKYVAGLSLGAEFTTNTEIMDDAWGLGLAAKYGNKFDISDIALNVSGKFSMAVAKAGDDTNNGFAYEFGVDTDSIIANTNLYAKYTDGAKAKDLGGADTKGKITVGAKIHF